MMISITKYLQTAGKILLFFSYGFSSLVYAGAFNLSPIRIELSGAVGTEVLHVTNSGSTDATIQLQTMHWSQSNGEDRLKSTRDIIATPQIFNLRSGASQLIRVGIAKKIDLSKEATYRLVLEEIPPPPPPGFQGLQVALRVSLPVFIKPVNAPAQSLDIRFIDQGDAIPGEIRLELINKGLVHVQLLDIKIYAADEKEKLIANLEQNIYLLAGQKKQITVKKNSDLPLPISIFIRAETRAGKMEFHATSGSP